MDFGFARLQPGPPARFRERFGVKRKRHDAIGLFSHQMGNRIPLCTIEQVTHKSQSGKALAAVVITVSDSCSRGEREDLSGPAVTRVLRSAGFETIATLIVPDEQKAIEDALRTAAAEARLVVTTGGTGIAARDVTPEATLSVCDRLLLGVAELMRAEGRRTTALAALSRGVCGTLGTTILLNVPGKPSAAASSLATALTVLPHALELLAGHIEHADDRRRTSRRKGARA
jgi:molybdopterin adenylyltransferase